MLTIPWLFKSDLVLQRVSRFVVFQTKVALLCFCLVRIKMPLLTYCPAPPQKVMTSIQGKTPWVDSACADNPGFLVPCAAACPALSRGRVLNTNFLFSNFSGTPRISQQNSQDIPPKSLVSQGFEGHVELFGPQPFTWKNPHPTRRCLDQKIWVWVPFSSLTQLHLVGPQDSAPQLACTKTECTAQEFARHTPWQTHHSCSEAQTGRLGSSRPSPHPLELCLAQHLKNDGWSRMHLTSHCFNCEMKTVKLSRFYPIFKAKFRRFTNLS